MHIVHNNTTTSGNSVASEAWQSCPRGPSIVATPLCKTSTVYQMSKTTGALEGTGCECRPLTLVALGNATGLSCRNKAPSRVSFSQHRAYHCRSRTEMSHAYFCPAVCTTARMLSNHGRADSHTQLHQGNTADIECCCLSKRVFC